MIDRLRKIASFFNLSPAAFAGRIEVSRPVISHIFSERNKPSLDVIQKIGAAFPEVDLNWLLYGNGEMLKNVADTSEYRQEDKKADQILLNPEIKTESDSPDLNNAKLPEPESKKYAQSNASKKVVRIVFFYADNTFTEFFPSQE